MYHEKPPLRLFAGNAVTYSKNFFYFTKFLKFIKLVPLMRVYGKISSKHIF